MSSLDDLRRRADRLRAEVERESRERFRARLASEPGGGKAGIEDLQRRTGALRRYLRRASEPLTPAGRELARERAKLDAPGKRPAPEPDASGLTRVPLGPGGPTTASDELGRTVVKAEQQPGKPERVHETKRGEVTDVRISLVSDRDRERGYAESQRRDGFVDKLGRPVGGGR